MPSSPFKQVDVFTSARFAGNPVAVVLSADALTTREMRRVSAWTNLSETAFVLPATAAEADYRVRVFTPASELPFAGHPTIGTAHALLEAGLIRPHDGRLLQECAAGTIALYVQHDENGERRISFDLPRPSAAILRDDEIEEVERILGTRVCRDARPRLVEVGPRWLVAQLPSAEAVLSVVPDLARLRERDERTDTTGLVIFGEHQPGAGARIEVRTFAPASGVDEDPVCGSGTGGVAAFIRDTGQLSRFGREFVSSQGAARGRSGRVHVAFAADGIRIGGAAVTCIDGRLSF